MLPPDCLYKFTTIDGTEDILTLGKIFFPSPADFNDPFDCKFHPIVQASFVKRQRSNRELIRERNAGMPKKIRNEIARKYSSRKSFEEGAQHLMARISKTIGILCLSARSDSVLMWSHYADKHRGICLEFQHLDQQKMPPLKVVYSNDYPTVDFLEFERFVQRSDAEAEAKKRNLWKTFILQKQRTGNMSGNGAYSILVVAVVEASMKFL